MIFDTSAGTFAGLSLQAALARLQGCFYAISPFERRLLVLRGGLNGRAPLSRRATARLLDISALRARQTERRALNELTGAAATGGCVSGRSLAAAPAPLELLTTPALVTAVAPAEAAAPGTGPAARETGSRVAGTTKPAWASRGNSIPWGAVGLSVIALGTLAGLALVLGGAALKRRRPAQALAGQRLELRKGELFARSDDEIAVRTANGHNGGAAQAEMLGRFASLASNGSPQEEAERQAQSMGARQ